MRERLDTPILCQGDDATGTLYVVSAVGGGVQVIRNAGGAR